MVFARARYQCVAFVFVACAAYYGSDLHAARQQSTDEQMIRDARARSNAAIAAHDPVAIGRVWMENVHVVTSTSVQAAGRELNQQRMARQFASRPDTVYIRRPTAIDVYPQWAIASERGEWTGRWTEPDGALVIEGTYLVQWRKLEGQWLIQAELYVPTRCSGGSYCRQRPAVAAIDKVLADAVARGDVPGVVAMVTDRRGMVYEGAFGMADVRSSRPMTVDTVFRIASMTKPVTSLAVMQLVEQGRLSLDDPAEKYLPQLANLKVFETFDARTGAYTLRPARRAPTVRHLLTHTAGFGYNFTSPIVRDFKPRASESYPAGPLLFEPGEQWLYSTGIDWGGRIIEAVSRKNLEAYFRESIFTPLGMADTAYNPPEDRQRRLAVVHRRGSDGTFQVEPTQPPAAVTQFIGGGGLASTAPDYIRFLRMLLNEGTLNGARIVSADTVATMGRNHIGGVGVRAVKTAMPERSSDFTFVADGRDKWGIGFMITADGKPGGRSAGSLSWGGLNNTYFWIDPTRGVAGVILMQYLPFADSKALALYDAFERAIYELKRLDP